MANIKDSKQVMIIRLSLCRRGRAEAKPHVHQFISIADALAIIETWRVDYNQRQPHSPLRHLTPNEFVAQRQGIRTTEEVVCSG